MAPFSGSQSTSPVARIEAMGFGSRPIRSLIRTLPLSALVLVTTVTVGPVSAQPSADVPPAGVEILLPRGGIPAIFEPEFIPAGRADLPDDAWILGVVIDGDARAYSLNLLNQHEVVNDVVGGKPVAAVW